MLAGYLQGSRAQAQIQRWLGTGDIPAAIDCTNRQTAVTRAAVDSGPSLPDRRHIAVGLLRAQHDLEHGNNG